MLLSYSQKFCSWFTFDAAKVQQIFGICKRLGIKMQIISLFQYVNVRFAEKSAAIGSNADNFKNGNI